MEWLRERLANQEGGADTWRQVLEWVTAPPDLTLAGGSSRAHAIRAQAEASALTGEAALNTGGY